MATDILELMKKQKIPTEVTSQLYVGNYRYINHLDLDVFGCVSLKQYQASRKLRLLFFAEGSWFNADCSVHAWIPMVCSASRNFEFIDAHRITHILTVADGIDPEYPTVRCVPPPPYRLSGEGINHIA
jgi:hypothetical protein